MPAFAYPPELPAFLLASLLIELTPGPNMTWLAILTLTDGRRKGLEATVGIATGLLLLGVAAALGVAGLVAASPALYEALRWSGIAFLVYLAWEGWRGGDALGTDGQDPGRAFLRGLIANLLNPKAAVFYVTVLPVFVLPSLPVTSQTLILTLGYGIVATAVHVAIVLLADRLQPYLMEPRRARLTRRLLSAALFGVALWFAWSTAR